MTSLREIQTRCRRAFLAGDANALCGLLRPHAEDPDTGIGVYQNNARETFRLALAASYPLIEDLVGAECFAGLASGYLRSYTSSQPDLQAFGEQFPIFLDRCYSNSSYRYLADVARLELATEQVLLQREAPPLDASSLASVPATALPELRLSTSPASRLVASEFPIFDIWRMHYRDDSAPVSLDAGPSYVLVLRHADNVTLYSLSALEYELSVRLSRGQSIGSAFESLSKFNSISTLQVALTRLLGCHVFVDIK